MSILRTGDFWLGSASGGVALGGRSWGISPLPVWTWVAFLQRLHLPCSSTSYMIIPSFHRTILIPRLWEHCFFPLPIIESGSGFSALFHLWDISTHCSVSPFVHSFVTVPWIQFSLWQYLKWFPYSWLEPDRYSYPLINICSLIWASSESSIP